MGTAHGGANEAALKMLEEISSVKHIPEFVRRAKDKNDSFRLMASVTACTKITTRAPP